MTSTRDTSSDTISGGRLALVFNTDALQVCNMYSSCNALALALRCITHFVSPPSPRRTSIHLPSCTDAVWHRWYPLSKTLAERAAWSFMETNGPGFTLAVMNPCLITGPALQDGMNTSTEVRCY